MRFAALIKNFFDFLRENLKVILLILLVLGVVTGHIPLEMLIDKLSDPVALITIMVG